MRAANPDIRRHDFAAGLGDFTVGEFLDFLTEINLFLIRGGLHCKDASTKTLSEAIKSLSEEVKRRKVSIVTDAIVEKMRRLSEKEASHYSFKEDVKTPYPTLMCSVCPLALECNKSFFETYYHYAVLAEKSERSGKRGKNSRGRNRNNPINSKAFLSNVRDKSATRLVTTVVDRLTTAVMLGEASPHDIVDRKLIDKICNEVTELILEDISPSP